MGNERLRQIGTEAARCAAALALGVGAEMGLLVAGDALNAHVAAGIQHCADT